MSEAIQNHLVDIIRPLFPENAEFKLNSDNQVTIFWKLGNDEDRPNKRSKIIRLNISREFMEDYDAANENIKQEMETKFSGGVSQKLANFDPDHNAPYGDGTLEPEEIWVVPSL